MKNYQRLTYQNYYAQDKNGQYIKVSRKACFSPAHPPTKTNPFKQRWFYDEEAGYAVRLDRTSANEDLHRFNSTSLKREERYRDRKSSCVWKDTANCDQNCDQCNRKNTRHTVELDRTWTSSGNDEMVSIFEPIDDTQNIINILEDQELLATLASALEKLSPDDVTLYHALSSKEKKKVIADILNLKSVDGVRYRELELRKKLLLDASLKNILGK